MFWIASKFGKTFSKFLLYMNCNIQGIARFLN